MRLFGQSGDPVVLATLVRPELRVAVAVDGVRTGLSYRYFNGKMDGDRKAPDAFRKNYRPAASGIASVPFDRSARTSAPGHHWFLYEGYLRVPRAGIYRFHVTADRLARLYIGDADEEDVFSRREAGVQSGAVALAYGLHPIRVAYLCPDGTAIGLLAISWEGPGVKTEPIPASVLFHR